MPQDPALPQWPCWPPDWPEIRAALEIVLQDGQWGQYHTQVTERLSRQLADQFGSQHVHLCASATAGIELALRAARLNPGDEVVLAAFDFPGNFRTVELLGMRPVLVDCCRDTVQMDLDQLVQTASPQTRAVIVSHLYGVGIDLQALRAWADNRDILLIEDACHCPGALVAERTAGTTGHVGVISFGGSKTLTSGNGGAILTDDPAIAQRARVIAHRPSDCTPLSALQAAVLLPQLARLGELAARRRQTAEQFTRLIETSVPSGYANLQPVETAADGYQPDFYKFAFLAPDEAVRNRAAAEAEAVGFPLRAGYRSASRVSPRRCRRPKSLPNAERLGNCLLTIDHPVLLAEPTPFAAVQDFLSGLLTRTV